MNDSSSSFVEDKRKPRKKSKGSFPSRVGEAKPGLFSRVRQVGLQGAGWSGVHGPFPRVRQVGFQGAEQRGVLIFLLGKTQQKREGW